MELRGRIYGILAVLALIYGIAVASLRTGTRSWTMWAAIAALFGIPSILCLTGRMNHLPIRLRMTAIGLIGLGFAAVLITQAVILTGFSSHGEAGADVIIVLGAQVREDGPSPALQKRLDTAAEYLQENAETLCIVSGGQGANEPASEAAVMAVYLEKHGIDRSRILQEDQSEDTRENLLFSRKLLPAHQMRVGIVTNNFHVFRAVNLAGQCGYAHAFGIAAPSSLLFLPNALLRETFGVWRDCLKLRKMRTP